jgi:hypothetical protein
MLLLELHSLRFKMLGFDVRGTADVKQEVFHLWLRILVAWRWIPMDYDNFR